MLDIGTLFTVLVMVSAMASAFVWFLYSGHRPVAGIRSIAWANTLVSLGFLGIAARAWLPVAVSFPLANAMICAGYLLTLHGMAEFFRVPLRPRVLAAIGAAYCAEFLYFFYIEPSYLIRLFCYLMLYSLLVANIFTMTLREYLRTGYRSHLVACGFAGFLSLSFLLCALLSLEQQGSVRDILSTSMVNALVVIEQIVFVMGWTLSFTLMVSERLGREKLAAESNSRIKSEALANMSHELRTPLNAIIGFADVIDSRALGESSPKYREYVKDILFSGRHLLALINDILDIARIEAGKLDLNETRIDVAVLVDSVLRMTGSRAQAAGVTVTVSLARDFDVVVADELRLRQILVNLLVNAIKFTPEGGQVGLSTHQGGDGGSFVIADTGIGMDAQGIERAMTKYCRVETAFTRQREGIGLGLPLAAILTEAHGGRLTIDSCLGAGTTVTVSLPPGRCPPPQPLISR